MLQIAVCDDDVLECISLTDRIRRILNEMKIDCLIKKFGSGKQLADFSGSFDIIFLDIMMTGLDGIETARALREKMFDKILIFFSSSKSYVFEAYDVEAFHYLLKPIDEGKLTAVLKKALSKTDMKSGRFIIINKDREHKKLFLDDIYYFDIWGRKICAYSKNGETEFYGKICELEKKLSGDYFFRCHKSYLVNLKYVNSYNAHEITLDNGAILPVAKRRYDGFCIAYLNAVRKLGEMI